MSAIPCYCLGLFLLALHLNSYNDPSAYINKIFQVNELSVPADTVLQGELFQ